MAAQAAAATTAGGCRGEAEALASLAKFGITGLTAIPHDTVTTVDEWKTQLPKLPEGTLLAKNLFVKGKKGDLYLVVALAETATDLKVVASALKATGGLRFASPESLQESLGVVQGAVTPLALVNDLATKSVTVVLDAAMLAASGKVAFHPCRNDQTVCLHAKDLKRWITECTGHKVVEVDFAALSAELAASAPPAGAAPAAKAPAKAAAAAAAAASAAPAPAAGTTRLGVEYKKDENFPMWYQEVITKSELIAFSDISGCYILLPLAMATWNKITTFLTEKFESQGVEPCYFPLFISEAALTKEKDHIENFSPEVAWVTHSGDTKLDAKLAVRPTSETSMYPYYAAKVKKDGYRGLPIKFNQWCSVVRMEMSHCTPFIRSREFLWQEGHTAHATLEEADREVRIILNFYKQAYEELLAVPVVEGRKTEKEKFAGGFYTTTVEAFVPSVGRGVQGATSHNLGQNFGKMFNIEFEDPSKSDGSKLIPWQTSWGFTTRAQGVMYMVHSDDAGLVLAPRVAMVQVVLVPVGINSKISAEAKQKLYDAIVKIGDGLRASGIRAKDDVRDNVSPGWKFNHWELKGVPLRIEIGPSELEKGELSFKRRCDSKQWTAALPDKPDALAALVKGYLDDVHDTMLNKARAERKAKTVTCTEWKDFTPALQNKCIMLAPWCGESKCEDKVKSMSAEESKILNAAQAEDARAPSMGAKALCIPFDQPAMPAGTKCICSTCKSDAKEWVLFGRSY